MKFIQLTYLDDTVAWVNAAHIYAFEVSGSHTDVVVPLGTVQVKETPEEILEKINA